MVVVDTSVWISHLRKSDPRLVELLESGELMTHSAIIGELASGSLKDRSKFLGDLKLIPKVNEISADEDYSFIEVRKLYGKGLSWVDFQILASCLAQGCQLLTDDHRLRKTYEALS